MAHFHLITVKTQTMKIHLINAETSELLYEGRAIKNSNNAQAFPKTYEINTKPSMTVPDQSMSVREIMTRYAKGLPLEGQKVAIWEGEESDMPDISRMDLADRQEYKEAAEAELQSIKAKRAMHKQSKLKFKADNSKEDEIETPQEDGKGEQP